MTQENNLTQEELFKALKRANQKKVKQGLNQFWRKQWKKEGLNVKAVSGIYDDGDLETFAWELHRHGDEYQDLIDIL